MRQWFYRGSLKSCNYHCSYCPFSKSPKETPEKIKKDEKALVRFVDKIITENMDFKGQHGEDKSHSAVLILPYGEALIHPYYIREIARLSSSCQVDFVGCQSNFSFSPEKILKDYAENGGKLEKLRLWGTFHPEMASVEDFAEKCRMLYEAGISLCAGAVGSPERINEIKELREKLPDKIYLWINRMEGLKRPYKTSEICAFSEIDPYFTMEISKNHSNASACLDSFFVEADGSMRHCCLPGREIGNFYDMRQKEGKLNDFYDISRNDREPENLDNFCTRKRCSCFLSYCTQKKPELIFMEPYPMFRIPKFPEAVFFDIDGTLLKEGEALTEIMAAKIRGLSRFTRLYPATSLPERFAFKKLAPVWDCLSGGIYAGGGDCIIYGDKSETGPEGNSRVKEKIHPVPKEILDTVKSLSKKHKFKIHVYHKKDKIYKITLAGNPEFSEENCFHEKLRQNSLINEAHKIRAFMEDNKIQIVNADADKGSGIKWICKSCGHNPKDVWAFGNSREDEAAFAIAGHAVRINAKRKRSSHFKHK